MHLGLEHLTGMSGWLEVLKPLCLLSHHALVGMSGVGCVDTDATRSSAGYSMYHDVGCSKFGRVSINHTADAQQAAVSIDSTSYDMPQCLSKLPS